MERLQRKRLISRIASSPVTYIILFILLFLFVYSFIGAYKKSRLAREKVLASEEELNKLETQKQKLSDDLQNANTVFGVEKAIREKFNVVKEGEKVIMIVKEEGDDNLSEEKKKSFFDLFKGLFTKN